MTLDLTHEEKLAPRGWPETHDRRRVLPLLPRSLTVTVKLLTQRRKVRLVDSEPIINRAHADVMAVRGSLTRIPATL
jgi:hypothetical protein